MKALRTSVIFVMVLSMASAAVAEAPSWSWPAEYQDDSTQPDPDTHGNLSVWHYLEADPFDFDGSYTPLTRDQVEGKWTGYYGSSHPYIDQSGGLSALHPLVHTSNRDVIVGWQSPISSQVQLEGFFRDRDPGGGDGIRTFIHHDTTIIFDQVILNGGPDSIFNLTRTVDVGDMLYFRVNARTTSNWDLTALSVTLTQIPEPASLGLLVFGGLGMIRRRKA